MGVEKILHLAAATMLIVGGVQVEQNPLNKVLVTQPSTEGSALSGGEVDVTENSPSEPRTIFLADYVEVTNTDGFRKAFNLGSKEIKLFVCRDPAYLLLTSGGDKGVENRAFQEASVLIQDINTGEFLEISLDGNQYQDEYRRLVSQITLSDLLKNRPRD